jgi:hypothetical protein
VSIGKRAYNILRGHVNREWDRIQGLDRSYAEQELKEAMENSTPVPQPVANAEPTSPIDKKLRARQLLGIGPDAEFREIRKTFERLTKRSDPTKFPPGSPEAIQAAGIQQRVNWAYQVLTENVDVTEKRFQSLEIE